jgi:hypothetical protein
MDSEIYQTGRVEQEEDEQEIDSWRFWKKYGESQFQVKRQSLSSIMTPY